MSATIVNGVVPRNITEGDGHYLSATDYVQDEAALYDRQIRLWGLEAQQRMRNASVCVVNLRGVATELIKNIVLAGIGKLIILDSEEVQEEDLGAGFFFRDTDVGKKRVDAARHSIEALNPLVAIETVPCYGSPDWWDQLVERVDILCLTDGPWDDLMRIAVLCRKHKTPFYAGGSYGLTGYVFCDLLVHEYISPDRSINAEQPRMIKHCVTYPSFLEALNHDWRSLTKKQAKHQNIELVFSILALWRYQSQYNSLPSDIRAAKELAAVSNEFIASTQLQPQVMQALPLKQLETLASTAAYEFSPVCAVLGGLMGQDILKALGGRDPPIANLFVFDGQTGSGATSRLNMPA